MLRVTVAHMTNSKKNFAAFPKQFASPVARHHKKCADSRNTPRICRVRLDAPSVRLRRIDW